MSHVYRSFAIVQARTAGYVGFRTSLTKEGMWKCHYEPGDNPADEYAKTVEWAHHGEVAWYPNPKEPDRPARVGVLVVNITRQELEGEGRLIQNDDGTLWILPREDPNELLDGKTVFMVEPLTPSLWGEDRPLGPSEKEALRRQARGGSSGAQRAQSHVESPVKTALRIYDELQAASSAPILRKTAVEAAVAAGVNKSTAGTQFYHWQKARAVAK